MHLSQSTKSHATEAWRLLRSPFVFPPAAAGMHKCEWEFIDVDCRGCLLCGSIHECSSKDCKSVIVTDEAVVCMITGVCVNTKQYADNEYSDNVIVYSSVRDNQDALEARMAMIDSFVREMLLSPRAKRSAEYENSRRIAKYNCSVSREIRLAAPRNMIRIVQKGVALYNKNVFDTSTRELLYAKCSSVIKQVLCLSKLHCGFTVKDSELRNFVFGLMYLMRVGVYVNEVCLLPCLPQLCSVLPSETNVHRFLNFRSKHITETENKFKFMFRRISLDQLALMSIRSD